MKHKKSFLGTLLAMILVCCNVAYASSETEAVALMNTFPISESVRLQIAKEQPAIEAYNEIMDALDISMPHENDYPNYPKEYGGSYYKDEKLYICLVENTKENQSKYLSFVENPAIIEFEEVKNSYNDLCVLKEQIASNEAVSYTSVQVNVYENKVVVGVSEDCKSQTYATNISRLQALSYSDAESMIAYSVEPIASSTATEVKGGEGINGLSFTIGICGTYNGSNAILTAGHALTLNATYKYRYTNTTLGTAVYKRYADNQYYDIGVIQLTSNYTVSNKVLNNSNYTTITSIVVSPLVGTTLCKYGVASGFTTGEISATNVTSNYLESDGSYTNVKGLVKVNLPNGGIARGDSGGPLYTNHVLYGINSGGDVTNQTYCYMTPLAAASGFVVKTN